jgi:hypothetical protein
MLKAGEIGLELPLSPSKRILAAADSGDYPTTLALWDSLVLSQSKAQEMKKLLHIETLLNLYLASYVFNIDTASRAGSAANAAYVAARSMTVFRNYADSRKDLMMRYNITIFIKYQHIYKIAFPPTHPKYRDLFTEEWRQQTRTQIQHYLIKRLDQTTGSDISPRSPDHNATPS